MVVVLALSKVPISISTIPLTHRDIRIASSFQGGLKDVRDMLAFTARHEVHPWIVKVPLGKINDALELQKVKIACYCVILEADGFKEKGRNVEANKPVAKQYRKD
ncbi:MAG: hypothetical protein JOS17DRAFT_800672 [Linnemannia elongata]|nr:MAG: hypothetical protein JOS17DRAFT_800672 [Linnemannia elongata]